ncbi:hypothetical protein DFH11DRAFT_1620690 [Phellopilus nigrolimitatus]|nr:hypothetical protein DFH11DRAFT_1620690 [Phellopilus nigrolimitatus]
MRALSRSGSATARLQGTCAARARFVALFAAVRAVHINYHRYAGELRGLLFGRPGTARMQIAADAEGEG